MSYVHSLRALVGHRPLIIAGAAVLIVDKHDRLFVYMQILSVYSVPLW